MMTCKNAAHLLSAGTLEDSRVRTRLAVRIHLAMCRHCRAFKQQLDDLGRLAGLATRHYRNEPAPDFETRLARRLGREPRSD